MPAEGTPKCGGTLIFAGNGDVDHLDTASASNVVTWDLLRVYTRQLVTYPTTSDVRRASAIVADLAEEVPSLENSGISEDGLSYVFRIRDGVRWDAPSGPRQITAHDQIRGLKRLFNPVAPTATPQYFTDTIVGMAEFAAGFAKVPAEVKAIRDYIESHDVEGMRAVDDRTLLLELTHPAIDFLNIMATAAATPAPVEYLDHLPDSPEFRQHTISCGPYRIASYTPGKQIRLDRNPAWSIDTDDVRHAYVDEIIVVEGLSQEEAYERVASGTADLLWDAPPSPEQLSALKDSGDERFHLFPRDMLEPYLAFNMVSPNEDGAIRKLDVRRAIEFAVDKVAVSAYWAAIVTPTSQILPEISPVQREPEFYATDGHRGDPERARRLLSAAGYGEGLTLKLPVQDVTSRMTSARALRDCLARAGITVELAPLPPSDFWDLLAQAAEARAGTWDIVLQGWAPDWLGDNARSYIEPLFDGSAYTIYSPTYGYNYGFYNNPRVSELIAKANGTTNLAESHVHYRAAAEAIMRDAGCVPIAFMDGFIFRSARLRGIHGYPVVHGNIPELWIDE